MLLAKLESEIGYCDEKWVGLSMRQSEEDGGNETGRVGERTLRRCRAICNRDANTMHGYDSRANHTDEFNRYRARAYKT